MSNLLLYIVTNVLIINVSVFTTNNDLLLTLNAGKGKTFDFLHFGEMLQPTL